MMMSMLMANQQPQPRETTLSSGLSPFSLGLSQSISNTASTSRLVGGDITPSRSSSLHKQLSLLSSSSLLNHRLHQSFVSANPASTNATTGSHSTIAANYNWLRETLQESQRQQAQIQAQAEATTRVQLLLSKEVQVQERIRQLQTARPSSQEEGKMQEAHLNLRWNVPTKKNDANRSCKDAIEEAVNEVLSKDDEDVSFVDTEYFETYSTDAVYDAGGITKVGFKREPFPVKLYRMLFDAEKKDFEHIISFTADGKAFKLHDPHKFVSEIMPKYFATSKMNTFMKQLNLYNFKRSQEGPNRGGYCHPQFSKGNLKQAMKIRRKQLR